MGTFSQYAMTGATSLGEPLVANESYIGAIGAYECMEESCRNDRAIFEHVLGCDFAEAMANHGAITESDFDVLNEASGTGIFSKVIEFFKKLGEKIKGIIQNAIDKITAMCTKDGKELYNKFKKKINEKMSDGTYSPDYFKYKFCDRTSNAAKVSIADGGKSFAATLFGITLPKCENEIISGNSITGIMQDGVHLKGYNTPKTLSQAVEDADKAKADSKSRQNKLDAYNREEKYTKSITSSEISEYKDSLCSAIIPNSEMSSFAKDYDEYVFESEDEKEGFTDTQYKFCQEKLSNHTKTTNNLDKEKRLFDKEIRNVIKEAQNAQKTLTKISQDGRMSMAGATARTCAATVITMGNAISAVGNSAYAAELAAIKKDYKQARSLWIKAATFTKKTAKNEAALLEAYDEVSDYEVDQMMPEC